MNDFDQPDDNEEDYGPSKSQLKREMTELQALGEKLIALPTGQRARFQLPENLLNAILEYQNIRKHEAKRRQLQYIGKLMRVADHEKIRAEFEQIENEQGRSIQIQNQIKNWQERLLTGDAEQLTAFIDQHPKTDIQSFRQLLQKAIKEQPTEKPKIHTKKLYKAILIAINDSTKNGNG